MFRMTAIFFMRPVFPVASMARKHASGARDQDDTAHQTKDDFHTFYRFVISSEGSSSSPGATDSVELTTCRLIQVAPVR